MDNGNRGRNKNKSGSRENQISLRDFYYANTYATDSGKNPKIMKDNVEYDLKPFESYLRASIEQKGRSTADGAEFSILKEVSKEKCLEPKFTLIKPLLPGPVLEVKKPLNIYQVIVDAEDGDFDSESFVVYQRGGIICTFKEKVGISKGMVLVRLENVEAKQGINYNLYDDATHKDDSIKCSIKAIDFSDLDTDCFEGFDAKIERVEDSGESLRIHVSAIPNGLESISLFGEKLPVIKKISSQENTVSAKGYSILPQGEFYVVTPEISDKIKIYSGTNLISYEKIDIFQWTDKEIQELLQTKEVSVKNDRLVYTGEEEGEVTFSDKYTFNLKTEKLQFKRRLKDKQRKSIGTFIEVITDSKSIGDLESNVDVFFKENIDTLTDSLPYRKGNREFKIGWRDENQNLLEIAELVNGRLEKIGSDNLPERLYAKPDDWQLRMQQKAIFKLKEMPCSDLRKFLELFERKAEGRDKGCVWENFSWESVSISKWYILTDESYDGCQEQREFVQKALATKDFGFLDGPPGSGKTTGLLELVAQLVMRGKKVLLTASTNAAVDNILERLEKLPPEVLDKILAVRLGNENVISETVEKYSLSKINDADVEKEIVCRANLVCGTIFGVLKHPEFNLEKKNQPVRPLYDYLIVDEASKTTFQDFLIPALYSKHWILSGDLKQLTPYVEQETIQSSLEEMPEFDKNWQRVQTILQLAKDNRIGKKSLSFYIVVPPEQIAAAENLLTKEWYRDKIGIITSKLSKNPYAVSIQEIKAASNKAVILYGAKLLIIEKTIFKEVQDILPSHYTPMFDVESDDCYKSLWLAASVKYSFSFKKNMQVELGKEKKVYKKWKDITDYWSRALKDKSWAGEITWRLCRLQELAFDGAKKETVEGYKKQIEERLPSDPEKKDVVKDYCNAISGIALPSVLQLLQQGLDKEVIKNKKETTLNSGFYKEDFDCRHTMLKYQHRMHPVISKFSRENIYHGEALLDGSEMEGNRQWNCKEFGKRAAIWIDTKDTQDHRNENSHEVAIICEELKKFMTWTKDNPNEKEKNGCWSVACLTYYKKQERLLKQEIRGLFSDPQEKSWYHDKDKHIEVFIYTVDKFQGREADVVFLSLIKSGNANLGFMDSPNRLNVALTRARYQRVIVGRRSYFKGTDKPELLRELAKQEESK